MCWKSCIGLIAIIAAYSALLDARCCRAAGADCESFRLEMELKKEKLAEYVEALRVSHEKGDLRLMAIFNHEIGRIVEEMRKAEKQGACPHVRIFPPQDEVSPAKSDTGISSDMSCGELKQTLIRLLMRINALKRREHSMFSRLSAEEAEELESAVRETARVKTALRQRCLPGSKQGKLPRGQ